MPQPPHFGNRLHCCVFGSFPLKTFPLVIFFHEPNARRFIGCNSAAVDDDAEVSAAFNRSKEVHQSTLLTKES